MQWNITDYKEPGDLSFCPIATASLGIKKKNGCKSDPIIGKVPMTAYRRVIRFRAGLLHLTLYMVNI